MYNKQTPNLAIVPQPFLDEIREMIREINGYLSASNKFEKDLSREWIDSKEAQKILRVSPRTLQNYRDNRVIPFSQHGNKIYYRVQDIENFLRKNYIKAD